MVLEEITNRFSIDSFIDRRNVKSKKIIKYKYLGCNKALKNARDI